MATLGADVRTVKRSAAVSKSNEARNALPVLKGFCFGHGRRSFAVYRRIGDKLGLSASDCLTKTTAIKADLRVVARKKIALLTRNLRAPSLKSEKNF